MSDSLLALLHAAAPEFLGSLAAAAVVAGAARAVRSLRARRTQHPDE
ncbi:hypothetical protein ACIG3E_23450 [Streptomyces sp. NPDC053474]